MIAKNKVEFGDFQTPPELAEMVCQLLVKKAVSPETVIEPTCGKGAFLLAAAKVFSQSKLRGLEINSDYVATAQAALVGNALDAEVRQQDFFTHDWDAEFAQYKGDILILGNPPWVTNSTLSGINGTNLPTKKNFMGLRGIEALMGKSNFDISEWMLIRLLDALHGRKATFAMLCKTATARKFLRYAWRGHASLADAEIYRFDAQKFFGASVDACLLLARSGIIGSAEVSVYRGFDTNAPESVMGLVGKDFVSDMRGYQRMKHFDGLCPYQWRSGIKHDCAAVMELTKNNNATFTNKLGETFFIEEDCVYPLLKCTDIARSRLVPEKFVVVTQQRVGEDTASLALNLPQTWHYLKSHESAFTARKSAIYKNDIPFSIFGVGDYSFAPWKIAVSGLHKSPHFELIASLDGKPIQCDDTCYFLPFYNESEARTVQQILNSPVTLEFLQTLTFADAKRPTTTSILHRLNISALAKEAGLLDTWLSSHSHRSYASELDNNEQLSLAMEGES